MFELHVYYKNEQYNDSDVYKKKMTNTLMIQLLYVQFGIFKNIIPIKVLNKCLKNTL